MRLPREENPFLGWRSIRTSLERPDLFKGQLRAILRVGTLGRVRLLFPMISSLEEIRRAKELLEEAKEELRREGRDFEPNMPIGMMVETPSAVWMATNLIREVDFFSIGTNDLIQYLLAVDRNNRKVAQLYEPLHPAVLSAIHETVQAAKGAGKWAGMCGEMAADPLCTIVLLGLGLDDLSMGPFFVPVIKRIIRSVSYSAARACSCGGTPRSTSRAWSEDREPRGRPFPPPRGQRTFIGSNWTPAACSSRASFDFQAPAGSKGWYSTPCKSEGSSTPSW